jgi:hypothetical protein
MHSDWRYRRRAEVGVRRLKVGGGVVEILSSVAKRRLFTQGSGRALTGQTASASLPNFNEASAAYETVSTTLQKVSLKGLRYLPN